jgi:hypothetical protein
MQMLEDKTERLESREKIQFYWIPVAVELKLTRGPTRRQGNQSKKVQIVYYYHQWQILKPSGTRKARKNFTVSVTTPKGREEKATLKATKGMAELHSSAR